MNDDRKDQRRGERRKPVIIIAVIGVILLGIFVLILFFFHSYLESKASVRPGTILIVESGVRQYAAGPGVPLSMFGENSWKPDRGGVTLNA